MGAIRYPQGAEAAATVASVVAAIRGAGKPHTMPADCRSLNGAFFADLYHVRSDPIPGRYLRPDALLTATRARAYPRP